MDGEHPNRTVLFLDNAVPLPFQGDPNQPELSYNVGFSLSASTKQQIEEFEPSLIHITAPDVTCLHMIQYARHKEIPLMGTYHSNIPEYMNHYPGVRWFKHILGAFFRHQYNFLQALYVPTPFIHKHLCDHYNMDKVTNLQVWGRGIDLERFTPQHRSTQFRQKLGFKDSDVVLLWVGRLVAEKRPDIFANVVRRLHAHGVPFRALVIGAGPSDAQMRKLPNTHFMGWMSGEELAVAYASSDVFLFPSAVETFGNVTLEAAASGLPLIVEGGCSGHLVQKGVNGYACFGDDEDAWYESALNLLVNHKMRQSFSQASRKLSLNFEKRAVVRRMLENYTKVTEEFYSEFGGRHENRDAAFTKDGSFLGGTHPRPLGLIILEHVFVVVFHSIWFFMSICAWFQKRQRARLSSSGSMTALVPSDSKHEALASLGKHSQIEEADFDNDDDDDAAGMDAVAMDELDEETAELEELLPSSDTSSVATTTTAASSLSSVAASDSMSKTRRKRDDWQCAHALAKGFVSSVLLQWRLESKCRNCITICCSPTKWSASSSLVRERKDSSVLGSPRRMEVEDMEVSKHGRGDEELGRRVRSSHALDVA